jgi:hypothetical protein
VVLPGFGSLTGQFRQLLLKYDVVLMSAADAEVRLLCVTLSCFGSVDTTLVVGQAMVTCLVSLYTSAALAHKLTRQATKLVPRSSILLSLCTAVNEADCTH